MKIKANIKVESRKTISLKCDNLQCISYGTNDNRKTSIEEEKSKDRKVERLSK